MFFDSRNRRALLEGAEGELFSSRANDGEKVAVAKVEGTFYAITDRCPHLGCSLSKGTLEGTTVTCPCHGSQFDIRDGGLERGPATHAVRSYDVTVANDQASIVPKEQGEPA